MLEDSDHAFTSRHHATTGEWNLCRRFWQGWRRNVEVIDVLDESGSNSSRKHILSLLKSTKAPPLPSHFCILVTSRPLSDIALALDNTRTLRRLDGASLGEGETLLDVMYSAILESAAVGRKPKALTRLRSLMRQIIDTLEPLPIHLAQG